MTVTPSMTAFPLPPVYPLTQITPFTYRDGMTYLQVLNAIRDYLVQTLPDEVNGTIKDVHDFFLSHLTDYRNELVSTKADWDRLWSDFTDNLANEFAELAEPAAKAAVDEYLSDPSTLDSATANNIGRESETAIALQYAMLKPGQNVDIWPEVNIPDTYTQWIDAIDNDLNGEGIKRGIGYDSYGSTIHMYEAGEGYSRVLLVAGTHPFEFVGQASAKQFFVQFATSNHPSMVAMRKHVRLYLVPSLISGDFKGGRENANGVNVNRNYDQNHSLSSDPFKGAAPFDQPESQVIKQVIDVYKPSLVIDCHNYGSSGQSSFGWATSEIIHNKDATMLKAVTMWKRANPDFTDTIKRLGGAGRNATLANWAQRYIRFDQADPTAMSVTLECLSTLGGSNSSVVTRTGVRHYSSMIHQVILSWLESGQADQAPIVTSTHGHHSTGNGYSDSVADGGRLISNTEWQPITLPITSTTGGLKLLEVPLPYPGRIRIHASVNVGRDGTNEDPARVDIGLSVVSRYGDAPATGPSESTIRSTDIRKGVSSSISTMMLTSLYDTVPAENVFAVQLWVRTTLNSQIRISSLNSVSGSGGGARIVATTEPSFEPFTIPFNGF